MTHRFPALIAAPPAAQGRLWLTGARLFDGTGAPLRENAAVLIEDGIIRRVADAADADAAEAAEAGAAEAAEAGAAEAAEAGASTADGARVLDLGQRVLMPGLTDAHVHTSGEIPKVAKGAEEPLPGVDAHFMQAELRDYLRFGVTTIRVVGSQGLLPQQARQAMRYGAFRGPRLLTVGKIISATAPGGRFYGDMYREADGEDDVRRAVREQIRAGADLVKVMTTGARSNELEDPEPLQFTDAELAAVTDEAHRLGYRVAAHAEGLDGCAAAIRHGVDTIEHGMYLNQRPDLLDAMAAAGQVLVPTLSGYYWMSGLAEDVIDPAHAEAHPDMPPILVELAQRNIKEGAASMRAARSAGVKIALGSDTSLAVGLEIQRMIHHGLAPAETLVAATSTAAEALALDEQIGTVEEGKLADLIVVDGDPLAEPHLLSDPDRIWLVLQLGVPVAGRLLANPANPALADQIDRPKGPRPSDMDGWATHSTPIQ